MKKRICMLLASLFVASGVAMAQDYNWAIGVRGGDMSGISVKARLNKADAIEALLTFNRGVNIFALYERNVPVICAGFNFYYGAGANLGSWHNKFTAGIDGVVGLEYKIPTIPLAFSVDYKPCLNFVGHTGFRALDFGLGIKVTF